MTEFHVNVVRVSDIQKHDNADNLEIINVLPNSDSGLGYPCIVRKGEFNIGDLAIYIPIDSTLPDISMFSFLKPSQRNHLKALRLRGVFSMGLLVKAQPNMKEGDDVASILGIEKWEPTEAPTMKGENEHNPKGWHFPVYTDIEGLRRYSKVLQDGEEVVITEKIHGANARYVHDGERLWVGSRTCVKKYYSENMWWKVAEQINLTERLAKYPLHIFYGEVYGQVQDLKYGHKTGASFIVFDVYDLVNQKYLDHDIAKQIASDIELPWVPELYRGPWSMDLVSLSEGNSTLANHVREGFVVKPVKERYERRLGRVILKLHGQGYLTRK